jgi:hypothetical protein
MNINDALQGRARCLLAVSALIASVQLSAIHLANAATPLPANVQPRCVFSDAEFNSIFESGKVSPNGIVLPADSFSFTPLVPDPSRPNCSFYKWAEQMFLWLTSPVAPRFGSGSHVFASSVFYSLSPLDANGGRTLIPHMPDQSLPFVAAISQRGSTGQEVVFDSAGKIHDVIRPAVGPSGKLLVRNTAGQSVEVGRIQAAPDGKPLLLDRTNKPIDVQTAPNGAPLLHNNAGAEISVRPGTVLVNGSPRLVTTSGAVIETEEGQAGGGALMAQNNSLVFYLLQVNDVIAYFNTGMKNNKITPPPTMSPTTGNALGQIELFAQQAPAPFTKAGFPDSVALAVEVKSSWIETTNLANPGDYITIDATVPTYDPPLDQPNNTQSVQGKPKQTKLALVGMHVVGSVLGHPEMLWATFEHVNNTPNPEYTYFTTTGETAKQPADGPGGWVFSSTGAAGGNHNTRRMVLDGTTIKAVSNQTIGPSDLVRVNPWGTATEPPPGSPDPNPFTPNNTDIVSINRSVIGRLAADDVRRNYILIGSTWVVGGLPPTASPPTGTLNLANSTMETFFQGSNCLDCHSNVGRNMLGTTPEPGGFSGGLSHVWVPIVPLFP